MKDERIEEAEVIVKTILQVFDISPRSTREIEVATRMVASRLAYLATLGLWAEKHGVPALQSYDNRRDADWWHGAYDALAALPKESK